MNIRFILLVFATTVFGFAPAVGQQNGAPDFQLGTFSGGPTIPYGNIAGKTTFPGVARISFDRNRPGCTGTLISDRILITARHCIYGQGTKLKSALVVYFRESQECPQVGPLVVRISAENTYFHPRPQNGDNEGSAGKDIALVKLPKSAGCDGRRIVSVSSTFNSNNFHTIAGWGLTTATANFRADKLYFVPPHRITVAPLAATTLSIIDSYTVNGISVPNPVCNADSGAGVLRMINATNLQQLELVGVIQHYDVNLGSPKPGSTSASRLEHCIRYGRRAVAARSASLINFINAGLERLQ